MNIYIDLNGKKAGPYTLDEVKGRVVSGALNGSELACIDEATNWIPLNTLISFPIPQSKSIDKDDVPIQIFLAKDGNNPPPHSLDEVNGMLGAGALDQNDPAFHSGLASWVPLQSIEGIAFPTSREAQHNPVQAQSAKPRAVSPLPASGQRSLTFTQYFNCGFDEFKRKLSWETVAMVLNSIILTAIYIPCVLNLMPFGGLIFESSLPLIYGCPLYLILKRARGGTLTSADLATGYRRGLFRLVLLGIIIGGLEFVGALLLTPFVNEQLLYLGFIPAYMFLFFAQFAILLMIDKRLGLFRAVITSVQAVSTKLPFITGFTLLNFLLSVSGILACGIGAMLTGMISLYAWCFLYLDLFDQGSIPARMDSQPPL